MTVDHIDQNKKNNDLSNLRWATHKQQRNNVTRKKKYNSTALPVEQKHAITGEVIKIWPCSKAIVDACLGFNRVGICKCCKNKQKTHKGFAWSYSIVSIDGEEWKNLETEKFGTIEISTHGRVKTKGYPVYGSQQDGYMRVYFTDKLTKKGHKLSVHRLVAKAFIPNPQCLPVVNHKDGNKSNNKLENLEWVTQPENMKHARETGLVTFHRTAVEKIDDTGKVIVYESIKLAASQNDVSQAGIQNACVGRQKSAAGYLWKYV